MDTRKAQLLEMVIEEYIHTAQPVGSKILAEDGELDVSGATIRNELRGDDMLIKTYQETIEEEEDENIKQILQKQLRNL